MPIDHNRHWRDFVTHYPRQAVSFAVSFAVAWVKKMEQELEAGKSLSDIARPTAQALAKQYAISSYVYGEVVRYLWQCWPAYGEALRAWNNIDLLGVADGQQATRAGKCLNADYCRQIRP